MLDSTVRSDSDAHGYLHPVLDQSWDLHVPRSESCRSPEQNNSSTGTHLRIWPCAHSFCRWLEASGGCAELGWAAARIPSPPVEDSIRLLELGSGRGWLGMVLAKNLPGARVTLTDLPEATSQLRDVVSGAVSSGSIPIAPAVLSLDWKDLANVVSERSHSNTGFGSCPEYARQRIEVVLPGAPQYHTVFGTDLCWTEYGARSLAGVLSCFAWSAVPAGRPRVVLGHWNRSGAVTSSLVGELIAQGLAVRVVYPPGLSFHPRPGEEFLYQLICQSSPMAGMENAASGSTTVDAAMPDSLGTVLEGRQSVAEDWTQEDWEECIYHQLFEDASDSFPDPLFLVLEVVAARRTDWEALHRAT